MFNYIDTYYSVDVDDNADNLLDSDSWGNNFSPT